MSSLTITVSKTTGEELYFRLWQGEDTLLLTSVQRAKAERRGQKAERKAKRRGQKAERKAERRGQKAEKGQRAKGKGQRQKAERNF